MQGETTTKTRSGAAVRDAAHRAALTAALGALLFTAGCTSVAVDSEYSGTELARPDRVLVYDFAATPEEVKLDSGLSALAVEAMKSSSRTEQEIQTGHEVADALAKHLVAKISAMGLPAERASGPLPDDPTDVAITGHLLSIDEGNRTERVVIGLGAGRTDVRVEVRMAQNGVSLEDLSATAKSGRNPGMAETMGFGALAGHLVVSAVVSTAAQTGSEAFGSNVEADADRAASKIAKTIEPFFVEQGWVTK